MIELHNNMHQSVGSGRSAASCLFNLKMILTCTLREVATNLLEYSQCHDSEGLRRLVRKILRIFWTRSNEEPYTTGQTAPHGDGTETSIPGPGCVYTPQGCQKMDCCGEEGRKYASVCAS